MLKYFIKVQEMSFSYFKKMKIYMGKHESQDGEKGSHTKVVVNGKNKSIITHAFPYKNPPTDILLSEDNRFVLHC